MDAMRAWPPPPVLLLLLLLRPVIPAIPDSQLIFMEFPMAEPGEVTDRVASSCEDLATLLQQELQAFSALERAATALETVEEAGKVVRLVRRLLHLRPAGLQTGRDGLVAHVAHPYHSYRLLHRTTRVWPTHLQRIRQHLSSLPKKKIKNLTLSKDLREFVLPSAEDFTEGAINGLFNIQRFYNLSAAAVARGVVVESDTAAARWMDSEEAVTFFFCQLNLE